MEGRNGMVRVKGNVEGFFLQELMYSLFNYILHRAVLYDKM